MAITNSMPSPESDDWKACAVPWKEVLMVEGRVRRARSLISETASPMEVPGFKLKDMVTAGNSPRWFTESGPYVLVSEDTEASETSCPVFDRTCSAAMALASR